MRAPSHTDDYSWRRRPPNLSQSMREEDRQTAFDAALSAPNKYENDGGFLQQFRQNEQNQQREIAHEGSATRPSDKANEHTEMYRLNLPSSDILSGLSENQVAAKALQLRLRGNVDGRMNQMQEKQGKPKDLQGQREVDNRERVTKRHRGYTEIFRSIVNEHEHKLEKGADGDSRLVKSILQYKDYRNSSFVDTEYEAMCGRILEPDPMRSKIKLSQAAAAEAKEAREAINAHRRIVTQEERCQFCFNNQSRPKHLTLSIANSCYLMLPPWDAIVHGHCLIVPMQHEGASRDLDEHVWEEMRNYKKCLLQMFAKHNRDVIFLETAINLSRQCRHCLVECIPLPPNKAK
ncbi:hypothetical protein KP509_27G019100 [Ceratopteris richardii]|nr:hypothetical protein KP509_27G019100 [Ceratopteris richardii]